MTPAPRPGDRIDEHDVVEPMLAAHALAVLGGDEADRVDAHLAACAACRVTFDELCTASAAVEARVADDEDVRRITGAPPASLASDVLARIRTEPQAAAEQAVAPTPDAASPARRPARIVVNAIFRRYGATLVAASTLGACVLVLAVQTSRDGDRIAQLEGQLRDAKGDQVHVLDGGQFEPGLDTASARARVTIDHEQERVVFRDVAEPPDGMVWQVWQVDTNQRIRSIGVIPRATDHAWLELDDIDPDDLDRVFVTTEPEGSVDEVVAHDTGDAGTA